MRSRFRIHKIIYLLYRLWLKHPYLRLCQLIGNCFEPGDLYHIEDDELERKLKETYKL